MLPKDKQVKNNLIKGQIDKSEEQMKYIMCSRADETTIHIVRECPKLAQKEYKRRHDWIRRQIHWEICEINDIHSKLKWCEHKPEAVIENNLYRQTIL